MTSYSVTILIPAWNEETALPATLSSISKMRPQPDEVLLVDGGSEDGTVKIAENAGIRVVQAPRKGRGPQINFGVEQASGDIVCVLHADSLLPENAIAHIRTEMADPKTALASFTPRIMGPNRSGKIRTRWGTTFHNWIKTWYAPAIMKPHLFAKGVRLLFGDHAMFFRRDDYLKIGGIPDSATIMEEADLCIGFAQLGNVRMTPKWVITSDRRITEWGALKANYIYLKVGIMWCFGARDRLGGIYPDIR